MHGACRTTDIKPRQVEPAIRTVDGQERQIVALFSQVQQRLTLMLEFIQRREVNAAAVICRFGHQGLAIFRNDLDVRAAHGEPGNQRLYKHFATAIEIAFRQQPQIGD